MIGVTFVPREILEDAIRDHVDASTTTPDWRQQRRSRDRQRELDQRQNQQRTLAQQSVQLSRPHEVELRNPAQKSGTVEYVVAKKYPEEQGLVYTGRLVDGLRDGRGRATRDCKGGWIYAGSWQADDLHGPGQLIMGDTYFKGEFYAGKPRGWAVHTEGRMCEYMDEGLFLNGEMLRGRRSIYGEFVYDGDMTEWRGCDVPDGWGMKLKEAPLDACISEPSELHLLEKQFLFPIGPFLRYAGQWKNGAMHGDGVWLKRPGGNLYQGVFDSGSKEGSGRMMFADGGTYTGDWVDGKFHGRGKRIWACGDYYDGQWEGGKEHGMGTRIWVSEGLSFTGKWKGGEITEGTMKWKSGDEFTGTFLCYQNTFKVANGLLKTQWGSIHGILSQNGNKFEGDDGSLLYDIGSSSPEERFLQVQVQHMTEEKAEITKRASQMQVDFAELQRKCGNLLQQLEELQQKFNEQTEVLKNLQARQFDCPENFINHVLGHLHGGMWNNSLHQKQIRKSQDEDCLAHESLEEEEGTKVVRMAIERKFGIDESLQIVFFLNSDGIAIPLEDDIPCTLNHMKARCHNGLAPQQNRPAAVTVKIKPATRLQQENLQYIAMIGSGAFGIVSKFSLDKSTVAVKSLYEIIESEHNLERFQMESEIVAELRHPNIVKCIGTCLTSSGKLWIVSELMGCSLSQLIEKKHSFTLPETISVLLGISRGMSAIHQQNIMHRDLSSRNVVFDFDGCPKIIDFGVASRFSNAGSRKTIGPGNFLYMAPQMYTSSYTIKGDVWSFGILLTEIVNGKIVDSTLQRVPLSVVTKFINQQKQSLLPPDIVELDRIIDEAGEMSVAHCLSRRNACFDAVSRYMNSSGCSGMPQVCTRLLSLMVQSCLSITEKERPTFKMTADLLFCCATILFSDSPITTPLILDGIESNIALCLRSLSPFIP
ncbi:Serine/threonine-protein kinase STY46 [Pelomyxa schiedti]|nr:Serine/threonine-protein kinase STY46 [Pelomyxa schiedti]